jgi:hypothetical protein
VSGAVEGAPAEAELRSCEIIEFELASSDFVEELEDTESRSDPRVLRLPARIQV